jgi:RNA polymerase primary sigma factor
LQIYLREIKDGSLLTAAEECALAEAISHGDEDARSRMIEANLRLVVKIARDYLGRGLVLEDLVSEGNIGLIRATTDFKPGFGTRFSTYASYWIKQSIRHALINTTSTIRLPAHMVGILTRWRRAERALYRERGCSPTFAELASYLGLSEAQKSLVAKAHQARQVKLEGSVAAETGGWSRGNLSDRCESPGASLEADDERRILLNRLERLDSRERTILALRYGLEGESPLTLKAIGRRLGVTREWVRKIELRALRKLVDHDAGDGSHGAQGSSMTPSNRCCRTAGPSRAVASGFAPSRRVLNSRTGLRSREPAPATIGSTGPRMAAAPG